MNNQFDLCCNIYTCTHIYAAQQLLATLATNGQNRKLPSTHPYFVFSQQFEAVSQGGKEDMLVE